MISNTALPAFIGSLLPQPIAPANVENGYSDKQRRRGDEDDVQHDFSSLPAESFGT